MSRSLYFPLNRVLIWSEQGFQAFFDLQPDFLALTRLQAILAEEFVEVPIACFLILGNNCFTTNERIKIVDMNLNSTGVISLKSLDDISTFKQALVFNLTGFAAVKRHPPEIIY